MERVETPLWVRGGERVSREARRRPPSWHTERTLGKVSSKCFQQWAWASDTSVQGSSDFQHVSISSRMFTDPLIRRATEQYLPLNVFKINFYFGPKK